MQKVGEIDGARCLRGDGKGGDQGKDKGTRLGWEKKQVPSWQKKGRENP